MQQLKTIYIIFFIALFAIACQSESTNKVVANADTVASNKDDIATRVTLTGNYVTADYLQRNKGYDWVAVSIQELGKDSLEVKVRSRADIKKPTCTLDAIAKRTNEGLFEVQLSEGTIILEFANNHLTIKGKSDKDDTALYFHCSGGASLAGSYQKIDTALVNEK
jgi:hypothetical protein